MREGGARHEDDGLVADRVVPRHRHDIGVHLVHVQLCGREERAASTPFVADSSPTSGHRFRLQTRQRALSAPD